MILNAAEGLVKLTVYDLDLNRYSFKEDKKIQPIQRNTINYIQITCAHFRF